MNATRPPAQPASHASQQHTPCWPIRIAHLAVPLRLAGDLAAESHARLRGKLHHPSVRDRQGARLPEAHGADVRVGAVRAVKGAAGAVGLLFSEGGGVVVVIVIVINDNDVVIAVDSSVSNSSENFEKRCTERGGNVIL